MVGYDPSATEVRMIVTVMVADKFRSAERLPVSITLKLEEASQQ